jgi:hypothetical protein
MNVPTTNPTGIGDADQVRATIRRHGELLRHPEGFPDAMLYRSLAYLYAAYALGSRTAADELDAQAAAGRSRHPSPEVAMGMARGFLRLAAEAAPPAR